MKKALFFIFLCQVFTGFAQTPNEEKILMEISSAASEWYYPNLMLRYEAGDTTLTATDYHYLYYGYAYDDRYLPLNTIAAEGELLSTLGDGNSEPGVEQMLLIIRYGEKVRESDPFSPLNLNFLTYAYGSIGDTINERINYDRMTKVLATIAASGNGLKNETSMHVLRFEHAKDWITARGAEIAYRRVVSRTTEFISLKTKDEAGNRGYFFDFSRVYWKKPE